MKYQTEYNLGYRMGCGYGEAIEIPNKENWYALAVCILGNKSSEEGLRSLGLIAPMKYKKRSLSVPNHKYIRLANITYILNVICKVRRKEVAPILGINVSTVSAALEYRRSKND